MSDIFWYFNKKVLSSDIPTAWEPLIRPLPWKSISEIHWIGEPLSQDLFPQTRPIKIWNAGPIFDVEILLLDRLKAQQLESMLIVVSDAQAVHLALFGSGNLVGKYNLPPELEIHNSGWVPEEKFNQWINDSTILPSIYPVTSRDEQHPQFASFILELDQVKQQNQFANPLLFHSLGPIIPYIVAEKI